MVPNFLDNLNINGKLIVFLGKAPVVRTTLIEKLAKKNYRRSILFETVIPMLVGVTSPDKFKF